MFTGIVATTGRLNKIKKNKGKIYFTIGVKNFLSRVKIGESIACDGVCLTVIKKTPQGFTVELMPETLKRTRFGQVKVGEPINLELALKIGQRLDGHFVMGHVDGVGVIKKIIKEGEYVSLLIKVQPVLNKYLAYKGSVAANGVSLTVAKVATNIFKVCLITHTLKVTNLSRLKVGDKVNLEADMIAKYLEKLLKK